MIGNYVRIERDNDAFPSDRMVGVLNKLAAEGAYVWRTDVPREQQSQVFIPMGRIVEIVDLGHDA